MGLSRTVASDLNAYAWSDVGLIVTFWREETEEFHCRSHPRGNSGDFERSMKDTMVTGRVRTVERSFQLRLLSISRASSVFA